MPKDPSNSPSTPFSSSQEPENYPGSLAQDFELAGHFLAADAKQSNRGKVFLTFARWQEAYLATFDFQLNAFFTLLESNMESVCLPFHLAPECGQEIVQHTREALTVKRYERGMKLRSVADEILVENALAQYGKLFGWLETGCGKGQGQVLQRQCMDLMEYVQEAIALKSPALFVEHITHIRAQQYPLPKDQGKLIRLLVVLKREVDFKVSGKQRKRGIELLELAIRQLVEEIGNWREHPEERLGTDSADRYLDFMLQQDARSAKKMIQDCLNAGMTIQEIYFSILWKSNERMRKRAAKDQISLIQERYFASQTCAAMSRLDPWLSEEDLHGKTLIAVSVGTGWQGIELQMVADLFELEGWESYYLGGQLPDEGILGAIEEWKAALVILNVPTVHEVARARELIAKIREIHGSRICVLMTGEPFRKDPVLWKHIEADGTAVTPEVASRVTRKLIG